MNENVSICPDDGGVLDVGFQTMWARDIPKKIVSFSFFLLLRLLVLETKKKKQTEKGGGGLGEWATNHFYPMHRDKSYSTRRRMFPKQHKKGKEEATDQPSKGEKETKQKTKKAL